MSPRYMHVRDIPPGGRFEVYLRRPKCCGTVVRHTPSATVVRWDRKKRERKVSFERDGKRVEFTARQSGEERVSGGMQVVGLPPS